MRIRPLDPSSDALEPALGEAFERGLTRSERCFVADARDGRLAGLVAFGDPDDDGVVVVELLELPWDADHDGLGRRLLEESLAQLPERPAALWYLLDDPHPWHQRPEARKRLLESVGFEVARVTRRWVDEVAAWLGPVSGLVQGWWLERGLFRLRVQGGPGRDPVAGPPGGRGEFAAGGAGWWAQPRGHAPPCR